MRSLASLLLDLLLVAAATALAVLARDNFDIVDGRFVSVAPHILITLGVAAIVLPLFGISRSLWRFTGMRDYLRIAAGTLLIVVGAVSIGFLVNRLDGVARALPLVQGVLIVFFLVGARVLTRALHIRRVRPRPAPSPSADTVLVIGLNKLTELYLLYLAEFDAGHVTVAGLLDEGGRVGLSVLSHPVLGTPDQVARALRYLEVRGIFVDRIVVTMPRHHLSLETRRALEQIQETTTIRLEYLAERMGIRSAAEKATKRIPGEVDDQSAAASAVRLALGQMPYDKVKRAIDVVVSAALLIVSAPVFLLASLLVALDVGLPVLFWQQRPGLCGRPFKLYKFRTMAEAHHDDGSRIPDGERVSAMGELLRRTRLDELPQLFNILIGDMSFVGPRPLLPVDQPIDSGARLLVRPGLTGWAQIKGGREISAADKVALDVWYVRNMSLALDLEIVLGTIPMVLFGERITEAAIAEAWRELQVADNAEPEAPRELG